MLIAVTPNLSKLTVYAERSEQELILGARHGSEQLLEVWSCAEPVLLSDNARIGALEPGLRDAVFALYASYPRTVAYDEVEVAWTPQAYPRVWCPSIDTVFFARTLKAHLTGVKTIAEVGTGSGFLTKFALAHAPAIERALASDINLDALRCTNDALTDLKHHASVSLICPRKDDETVGFSGRFDLLLSNPPYIPRPGEGNDNPYEGLGLIHKLAYQGADLLSEGGVMLLNISTFAGDEPLEWLSDAGWQVRELDRLRVPLKINAVTSGATIESREWLTYLRGRGAVPPAGADHGYRLWHELRMLACRPRH
jgi:tRNA1(Val) A37 N6-methylase TrmN6